MIASDHSIYLKKQIKDKILTNHWYYIFINGCSEEIKLIKPRALEASWAKYAKGGY